jgi:uncharacterized cupin superfamily protein/GNAT superfamily N-acetyltransferase
VIDYRHDGHAIDIDALIGLFARGANWKMPLDPAEWRELVRHTPLLVAAWHEEKLVGFARLLTDFVRWANVYDVVVDPDYQRRGIGSALVRRLIDHPRVARVRTFALGTAEAQPFYERLGFVRDGDGHGMLLVRRDRDERLGAGASLAGATLPAERPARPPCIVTAAAVPEEPGRYPGTTEILSHGRPIGAAAGLMRLGVHVERLEPGHRASYPHAHENEEEFVFVLEGEVDAWIDGELHRLVTGDLAAFPAGTGIVHTLINNGAADAVFLAGGEKSLGRSRTFYPLNPERRERMRPGGWWDDAPQRPPGDAPALPR